MFDFSKIGEFSKILNQAKSLHEKQERFQKEQIELLQKILKRLEEISSLLKNKLK
jgi:hypothetical protein